MNPYPLRTHLYPPPLCFPPLTHPPTNALPAIATMEAEAALPNSDEFNALSDEFVALLEELRAAHSKQCLSLTTEVFLPHAHTHIR